MPVSDVLQEQPNSSRKIPRAPTPFEFVSARRAQSLYCAIGLATRRNPWGLAKRRNEAIAPYGTPSPYSPTKGRHGAGATNAGQRRVARATEFISQNHTRANTIRIRLSPDSSRSRWRFGSNWFQN
jgi:hypothetical protein